MCAVLCSSVVSGHFAFYCMQPLQLLFFTSSAGLLSTSIVAVLAISSPALRAASFVLFVLFCNGLPFSYQLGARIVGGRYHTDVPWAYIWLWAGSLGTFVLGLLVKSAMLPERALRTRFSDLFLTSHQLWHVCIHAAFVQGTFLAWDVYLAWRYLPENACPAPVPVPPSPPAGWGADYA